MASKAVFLDKDGTLIEDVPFNVDPDRIRLSDRALEALSLLRHLDYRLIVVTNQSGVARGLFPEGALVDVENKLRELLAPAGVILSGFYYCPHHPQGTIKEYAVECVCRKPQAGMLCQAATEHDLDLSASWLVGDILNDIEAGNRVGCRTILVNNNHETEWNLSPIRQPDFMVSTLLEAADVIVNESSLERDVSHDQ
jgi:D,D-heptose 1,7-bisphosphate phosphatase